MKINLVSCLFVLDTESSDNIRKNDTKKLKLLVKNNNTLPSINYDDGSGLKGFIRNYISSIINSDIFHLEQVFALGDKKYFNDSIDISLDGKYSFRVITDDNDMLSINGISVDYANYLMNLARKRQEKVEELVLNDDGVTTAFATFIIIGGIGLAFLVMVLLLS